MDFPGLFSVLIIFEFGLLFLLFKLLIFIFNSFSHSSLVSFLFSSSFPFISGLIVLYVAVFEFCSLRFLNIFGSINFNTVSITFKVYWCSEFWFLLLYFKSFISWFFWTNSLRSFITVSLEVSKSNESIFIFSLFLLNVPQYSLAGNIKELLWFIFIGFNNPLIFGLISI